jgi:hypothetical protein
MFAATPTPPAKQAKNGTPRATRGTPMSSRRTPGSSHKPVTKYKEAGCQTSPGFVRKAKQSNGDISEKNDAAEADGEKVVKKKAVKEVKTAGSAKATASSKRKAKPSPDEKAEDKRDTVMENPTPAMLEIIRRKKEIEAEKAAKKRKK